MKPLNYGSREKKMETKEQCNKWNECSAPICPLNSEKENFTWFCDEDICTKQSPQFVKTQRKILKKSKDKSTYYTYEMLNRNCIIKEGITGLNPDEAESAQLKKWIKNHKHIKELSEEEKQAMRVKFQARNGNLEGSQAGLLS